MLFPLLLPLLKISRCGLLYVSSHQPRALSFLLSRASFSFSLWCALRDGLLRVRKRADRDDMNDADVVHAVKKKTRGFFLPFPASMLASLFRALLVVFVSSCVGSPLWLVPLPLCGSVMEDSMSSEHPYRIPPVSFPFHPAREGGPRGRLLGVLVETVLFFPWWPPWLGVPLLPPCDDESWQPQKKKTTAPPPDLEKKKHPRTIVLEVDALVPCGLHQGPPNKEVEVNDLSREDSKVQSNPHYYYYDDDEKEDDDDLHRSHREGESPPRGRAVVDLHPSHRSPLSWRRS